MIKASCYDTVKVHYIGRLANGTIFDRTPEERPLHFILGQDEVIPGFDAAIQGMFQGESKTVTIPCDQAYGPSKPELIETLQRSAIPGEVELIEGGQLEITQADGSLLRLMIRAVDAQQVTLDANHPLAGQDLTFEIELQQVVKRPPEQPTPKP
ncbi:MAG: peptidylprolyl isomerase [Desulfuromonas sp.]|nr:MAG: peptidylprolyl isomerase [Desulfuromonas sp.]